MTATAWIVAVCAMLTVLGLAAAQWVSVKEDIRGLKETVDALDGQLALVVRSQSRTETLVAAVLGSNHPMVRRMREDS
jgi:hypothetical protein